MMCGHLPLGPPAKDGSIECLTCGEVFESYRDVIDARKDAKEERLNAVCWPVQW